MTDMHRAGFHEPDMAVDASARIPARRGVRVIEADGQDVFRAELEVGRQVHAPRSIAVRPAADVLAVEPDIRVSHGAVNIQIHAAALVGGGHIEMFAIPGDAPIWERSE